MSVTSDILQQMLNDALRVEGEARTQLEILDGRYTVDRQILQRALDEASTQVSALQDAIEQVE